MKMSILCAIAGVGLALATAAPAQDQPAAAVELKVGDQAPEFELQGSDGKVHKLSAYRGTTVVLAWFPKAFTGG
jgi:cytochrome oxidase Cu insertion factor (SCO1/SenC/PrrC family)